jgi:hypothetical protein
LNVKHRVCDLALLEDVLVLAKLENRFPGSDFGDKDLRIKLVISWLSHGSLLWLDVINSRWLIERRRISARSLLPEPAQRY